MFYDECRLAQKFSRQWPVVDTVDSNRLWFVAVQYSAAKKAYAENKGEYNRMVLVRTQANLKRTYTAVKE